MTVYPSKPKALVEARERLIRQQRQMGKVETEKPESGKRATPAKKEPRKAKAPEQKEKTTRPECARLCDAFWYVLNRIARRRGHMTPLSPENVKTMMVCVVCMH